MLVVYPYIIHMSVLIVLGLPNINHQITYQNGLGVKFAFYLLVDPLIEKPKLALTFDLELASTLCMYTSTELSRVTFSSLTLNSLLILNYFTAFNMIWFKFNISDGANTFSRKSA